MRNVKEWIHSKYMRFLVMTGVLTGLLMASASAAGENEALTTAMTTGFTQIKTDALAMLGVIVPIALSIAAAIFVVRKAIGWFKSLAK